MKPLAMKPGVRSALQEIPMSEEQSFESFGLSEQDDDAGIIDRAGDIALETWPIEVENERDQGFQRN